MEHSVLAQALQALDASEQRIVQLLAQRHRLASRLAQAQGTPCSLEDRVATIVSRLTRRNPGPLDELRLVAIFETIVRVTEPLPDGLSGRNGAAKKG